MICSENTIKTNTLVDLLLYRANHQAQATAYTFLIDGEKEETNLTYQELETQVKALAAYLQSICSQGDRVLLLYPPSLEYIVAFFACLYAGVTAVPAYPPRVNRSLLRLQTIVNDAEATVALTNKATLANLGRSLAQETQLKALKWLATDRLPLELAKNWQNLHLSGENLAFLQYTSGSTAEPKGVKISHANLLHNLNSIHRCFQHNSNSKGVIWLPPYHDMGLIGGILQPLYGGFPVILMSPLMFLQSPIRWLQAISRYKGTTSGGPNFAYELCVRKIKPEQLANLDLSSWEVAFNGAEPIDYKSLERFAKTFEPCGFRPSAFYPCYGMAEATLIVSGGAKNENMVVKTVSKEGLEQNRAISVNPEVDNARILVSCGKKLPDQQIAIVNPKTLTKCQPREIGEIWLAGPSIAQGYWCKPEATKNTFRAYLKDTGEGPFLRTGDLGFIEDEELFVTGRSKDIIIINGRNHYPQDIERTIEQSHPWLRPSCSAAFAVNIGGEEKLVAIAEIDRRYLDPQQQKSQDLIQLIRKAVFQNHDLHLHSTILLKPGSIPKTSSGKIQRHACRTGFLENSLNVIQKH